MKRRQRIFFLLFVHGSSEYENIVTTMLSRAKEYYYFMEKFNDGIDNEGITWCSLTDLKKPYILSTLPLIGSPCVCSIFFYINSKWAIIIHFAHLRCIPGQVFERLRANGLNLLCQQKELSAQKDN